MRNRITRQATQLNYLFSHSREMKMTNSGRDGRPLLIRGDGKNWNI